MVPLPIGFWTGALLFDLIATRRARWAADVLVGSGIAAAVPTAAAGLSDWADAEPEAAGSGWSTSAATPWPCCATRRRWRPGCWAGARPGSGWGWPGGGDQRRRLPRRPPRLRAGGRGGEAAHRRRAQDLDGGAGRGRPGGGPAAGGPGRRHRRAAVPRGQPAAGPVGHCTHELGPLAEGTFADGCVTCPWHGSTFRLADGKVVRGPAAAASPSTRPGSPTARSRSAPSLIRTPRSAVIEAASPAAEGVSSLSSSTPRSRAPGPWR